MNASRPRNIVTLGGGTGTFVVLSALRLLSDVALTAIVSSADDGGSTGHLRDAYGFLPAGDARQALVALAEETEVLRKLFAYRFDKGNVAGHNLGNLFLTALTDLLGSDALALAEASKLLRVKGTVLQASDEPAVLVAEFADGTVITGEAAIDERVPGRAPIAGVSYAMPVALSAPAAAAIAAADAIVLGPGDLYTSTAAALLAEGTREALAGSRATLVYVCNLFTKAGQTDGMTVQQHCAAIARYAGRMPDRILINTATFSADVLARYGAEGEYPVADDLPEAPSILRADLASVHMVPPLPNDPVPRSLVRHDSGKLKEALAALLA